MRVFLGLAGAPLLPFTANILSAILPCLSYDSEKVAVKNVASEVNKQLKLLITPESDVAPDSTADFGTTVAIADSTSQGDKSGDTTGNDKGENDVNTTVATLDTSPLNVVAVLEVLLNNMDHRAQDTRIETLQWLLWLHQQVPRRTYLLADKLFPSLINLLSDNSDKVCVCVYVFIMCCIYMQSLVILIVGGNT